MEPPTLAGTVLVAATYPARVGLAFGRTTLRLARLTAPGGPILRPGGHGERFALLRDLTGPDRPLGQAVGALVPALHEAVEGLTRSVGPLGELAGRFPLTRKRSPRSEC